MKKPFDILRAVFWLVAIVILIEMIGSIAGGVLCWVINFYNAKTPGACLEASQLIREVWNEALTAVMALLIAGGRIPPMPPSNENKE